jgi:hypothetical protein
MKMGICKINSYEKCLIFQLNLTSHSPNTFKQIKDYSGKLKRKNLVINHPQPMERSLYGKKAFNGMTVFSSHAI